MKPPLELQEFLRRYDPPVQALVLGLRSTVLEELTAGHEYIFQMRNKLALIYSSTERVIADGICLISVHRQHVTLMFSHGADLADPDGVLKGTGKAMRHIRLARLPDLDRPEIRMFLRRARKHAGLKRSKTRGVVTRVKSNAATKRTEWPDLF